MFDFFRVYANIKPGILYGIIYNNSFVLVAILICINPNINPDININKMSVLNIFLKFNLNTNSSVIGARIAAVIIEYIGYLKSNDST